MSERQAIVGLFILFLVIAGMFLGMGLMTNNWDSQRDWALFVKLYPEAINAERLGCGRFVFERKEGEGMVRYWCDVHKGRLQRLPGENVP